MHGHVLLLDNGISRRLDSICITAYMHNTAFFIALFSG